MGSKASIYQAQGNLQEAASYLPQIDGKTPSDGRTPSDAMFLPEINQLRFERNYGEALQFLQALLAQFHFDSQFERPHFKWSLL
jgi:hypothetical protein